MDFRFGLELLNDKESKEIEQNRVFIVYSFSTDLRPPCLFIISSAEHFFYCSEKAVSIANFAPLAPKRNELMKTTKIITKTNQYE